jgi:hypothetical protein
MIKPTRRRKHHIKIDFKEIRHNALPFYSSHSVYTSVGGGGGSCIDGKETVGSSGEFLTLLRTC